MYEEIYLEDIFIDSIGEVTQEEEYRLDHLVSNTNENVILPIQKGTNSSYFSQLFKERIWR